MHRVLIVEDEPELQQLYKVACELAPFEVCIVDNITDAMQEYRDARNRREPFDLLILDIRLKTESEHTGIYVAQQVREAGDSQTKIVFLTGMEDEVLPLFEQTLGITATWTKPMDAGIMPEKIAEILGADVPTTNRRFGPQRRKDGKASPMNTALDTLHLHRKTHFYLKILAVVVAVGLIAWLALLVRALRNTSRLDELERAVKAKPMSLIQEQERAPVPSLELIPAGWEKKGKQAASSLSFSAHVPGNKTALPEPASHGWQDVKVRVLAKDAKRVREYFQNPDNRNRDFTFRLESN